MPATQPPQLTHAERIRQLTGDRQRILNQPPEHMLAAILAHPQPAALVHAFPEADLHVMIHDIGLENAIPLIGLASNRQWEYLLDVEVWHRDRLDHGQTTLWLQLLLTAAPDRLAKWFFNDKLKLLELYLFRNIELRIRESDQAPSDFGEGFFTDDDTFYIRYVDYPASTPEAATAKAQRNEMIGQLLRRLSIFDHPRFQGMLMEAVSLIPSETEEELYRLRNIRLGEKGLLPFEEAIGVYQPLRPGDLAARGKKVFRPPPPEGAQLPVPQFAASFLEGDNLFVRALKRINQSHIIDQLQAELAALCNQVITADQLIVRRRDQLKPVVAKVSGYLSIGLELMIAESDSNREPMAADRLRRHLLADIFKIGFAEALQLKWRAGRWHPKSWCHTQAVDLTFWDEAWLGLLGGLLIEMPQFYDPGHVGSNYRDFRALDEIQTTGRGLDQVMALDRLFGQLSLDTSKVSTKRFVTYKNVLLTHWARTRLNLPPADAAGAAIALSQFVPFYDQLWTGRGDHRHIADSIKSDFLQWAAASSGNSTAELSDRLGLVFESLFDDVERQLGFVRAGNLDPRHVHLFLLKS